MKKGCSHEWRENSRNPELRVCLNCGRIQEKRWNWSRLSGWVRTWQYVRARR